MTPEQAAALKSKIRQILAGIDETETCSEDGWWETSAGAQLGAGKLAEVLAEVDRMKDQPGGEL